MRKDFVSILMLTYNAPRYVEISIRSLAKYTNNVAYELIVLDNASEDETRELVERLKAEGLIHKLRMMDRNSLFAEGNNLAAAEAATDATHYLLLNSDVEVKSDNWLKHLLSVHRRGITSYGVAPEPDRVDGYCLLIDADLYRKHPLDVSHQWWWCVTKMQAAVLKDNFEVRGYAEHEEYLHHFGGKSGSAFKNAKGMNVTRREVYGWFGDRRPFVIDQKPDGSIPGRIRRPLYYRAFSRMKEIIYG